MALIFLWPERGPALVDPEGPAEEGTSHAMFVVVEFAAFPMMVLAGLSAIVSLFFRFRRAKEDERQQIKWIASASALSLAFMFAWNFLLDAEGGLLQASLTLISLQALFRTLSGQESQLTVVVSPLAIATLFSPLRRLGASVHRSPVLPAQIRRGEDVGRFRREVARVDGPRGAERQAGGGDNEYDAAGPRVAVVAAVR
jgi:hypothetical protein